MPTHVEQTRMSFVHQQLPGFVAAQPGNHDLLSVRTDSTSQTKPG
jgi:hypothetical protein